MPPPTVPQVPLAAAPAGVFSLRKCANCFQESKWNSVGRWVAAVERTTHEAMTIYWPAFVRGVINCRARSPECFTEIIAQSVRTGQYQRRSIEVKMLIICAKNCPGRGWIEICVGFIVHASTNTVVLPEASARFWSKVN